MRVLALNRNPKRVLTMLTMPFPDMAPGALDDCAGDGVLLLDHDAGLHLRGLHRRC